MRIVARPKGVGQKQGKVYVRVGVARGHIERRKLKWKRLLMHSPGRCRNKWAIKQRRRATCVRVTVWDIRAHHASGKTLDRRVEEPETSAQSETTRSTQQLGKESVVYIR